MSTNEPTKRWQDTGCKCRPCVRKRKIAATIFAAARPAGDGVTDDMVKMWNEALLEPCYNAPEQAPSSTPTSTGERDAEQSQHPTDT